MQENTCGVSYGYFKRRIKCAKTVDVSVRVIADVNVVNKEIWGRSVVGRWALNPQSIVRIYTPEPTH